MAPRLLSLAALCLLLAVLPSVAAGQRPSILLLNSYHNGYRWSDNIVQGFRDTLAAHGITPELHIEYLDAKLHELALTQADYRRLLENKYGQGGLDVVVATDNDAFDFFLSHRQQLFPDTPMVFCGVNDLDETRIQGLDVTGVVENAGIRETLRLAFLLHQQIRRVVVLSDESVTGQAIRNQVREAAVPFLRTVAFDYWQDHSLPQILHRLPELGPDTIVYFIPSYFKMDGYLYEPGEILELLSTVTDRPLYSSWSFLLGHGIVGGAMASGFVHGQESADMVLRILAGERARNIPVLYQTELPWQFDYLQLKRFGIEPTALPQGSTIINAPPAFYEISKDALWTLVVSFVLLALALVLLVVNITRRKRSEATISTQLAFQELLMDTIPQLVSWKDREHRYLGANRSFARFFGIPEPAALIGKANRHFIAEARFTEWSEAVEREVLDTGRTLLRKRISLEDKTGETVWLELNMVPLYDAEARVVGTLSTAEDVTREVSLERQLLQSQKMEAIGALAGGVAHDFNNILTSIINSTELALTDLDEASATAEDLQRVLKAAGRGRRLVQQILAFSRPSQEGFRPTDLAELVRETVAILKPSLPRNIAISATVDADAPVVRADPTQMHQVLMNLCTNAFQAMGEAGGTLELRLEQLHLEQEQADILNLPPGLCFRLTVVDDGPGVEPALQDKIFDPFFTTKGLKEGTGLGLAMVLGIVKNHGGAVRVESMPGQGAAFEVYIPARKARVMPAQAPQLPPPVHEPGQGRILFVEDDEDQLQTIPRVLESLGYEVLALGSVLEAMALLEAGQSFELVLTDFDMPEANGVELARFVARMLPGTPVIMVSGRGRASEVAQAVPNIRRFLPKPFSRDELSRALREVLGTKPDDLGNNEPSAPS